MKLFSAGQAVLVLLFTFSTNCAQSEILSKVDSSGRYMRFPGVTVIAPVGEENSNSWKKLYDGLKQSSLIQKYYALLPMSSYHMTTLNLFTEQETKSANWVEFVDSKRDFFQMIDAKLKSQEFHPQVQILRPEAAGTIHLIVRMDGQHKSKVLAFGREASLPHKVPNPFHITLGYLFTKITQDQKREVEFEVQKLVSQAFGPEPALVLDSPRLCFFNDMVAFIPWDGKSNPFRSGVTHVQTSEAQ